MEARVKAKRKAGGVGAMGVAGTEAGCGLKGEQRGGASGERLLGGVEGVRAQGDSGGRAMAVTDVRGGSETTLALARHLPAEDRELIEVVYGRGGSAAGMARAARVGPRRLQRRLNVVMNRLASGSFRQVVARSEGWPGQRRRIAMAVFVHGKTLRAAASEARVSLHTVRRELERIRGMLEESARQARETEQARRAVDGWR